MEWLFFILILGLVLVFWFKKRDNSDETISYKVRDGKTLKVDEVSEALASGDLKRMINALELNTHPIDRHYLLLELVRITYKGRKTDPKKMELCESIAWKHIEEFPKLAGPLKSDDENGSLPHVPTFQLLATLLTEKGEYDKAIEVCKKAIEFGLDDLTKKGYEGRIHRITKLKLKK
jgi:hypothetical protein